MGNLGQEATTRMVKVALDHGVNFIDTADVYSLGESETRLGNALKGIREEIVLAKSRLGTTGLDDAIDQLEALPFIVAPPATPLLKRAARLGRELGLIFYDASLIALAMELDCPYITADRRLYDHARSLPRVRHLSRVGSVSG